MISGGDFPRKFFVFPKPPLIFSVYTGKGGGEMKRGWILGLVIAAVIPAAIRLLRAGRKPFRTLEAADISAARVELLPPDVTLSLDAAEIETLAGLLRDCRIKSRDDSYMECEGQAVIFTLTLADGTVTDVNAYGSFLILDGAGYLADHNACQALSAFGNQLHP